MFCTICGAKIVSGSMFCPECAVCISKGSATSKSGFITQLYCSICGEKSISAYCTKCGAPTERVVAQPSEQKKYVDKANELLSGTAENAKKYVGKVTEKVTEKMSVVDEGSKKHLEMVKEESKKHIDVMKKEVVEIVKDKPRFYQYCHILFVFVFIVYPTLLSPQKQYYLQLNTRIYLIITIILTLIIFAGFFLIGDYIKKGSVKKALDINACLLVSILMVNSYILFSITNSNIEYNTSVLFVLLTVFCACFVLFKGYFLFATVFPDKKEQYLKNFDMPKKLSAINDKYLNGIDSATITVVLLPFFYNSTNMPAFMIQFAVFAILAFLIVFFKHK